MIIKELIKILSKYPEKTEIYVLESDYGVPRIIPLTGDEIEYNSKHLPEKNSLLFGWI